MADGVFSPEEHAWQPVYCSSEHIFDGNCVGTLSSCPHHRRQLHCSPSESDVSSSHSTTCPPEAPERAFTQPPRRVVGFQPIDVPSDLHDDIRRDPTVSGRRDCQPGELKRQISTELRPLTSRGHPTKVVCLRPLEEYVTSGPFSFGKDSGANGYLRSRAAGTASDRGRPVARSLPVEIPRPRAQHDGLNCSPCHGVTYN
mmetsp:Transcript_25617/g.71629  ORF Transcript_25617/g.71629 Transcript_25617/m.71629 type:complete len:200 (-) Transcript_25617:2663-3262(-)